MKQIRKKIFETNSSSTHSVTYTRDDVQTDIAYKFKEISRTCDELSNLFSALAEMDSQHTDRVVVEEDY